MGLWVSDVPISADESVRFQGPGGVFRKRRLVGGALTVTDQRFIFVPNRLDGIFGAVPVVFDRDEIERVELAPPGQAASIARGAAASRRPQIEIHCRDGALTVVIVKDPEPLIELLTP